MLTSRGFGLVASLAGDDSVCWVFIEPRTQPEHQLPTCLEQLIERRREQAYLESRMKVGTERCAEDQ